MSTDAPEPGDAFHRRNLRGRSFEARGGCCPAGRRGFTAARDHRCSVTSTRPFARPLSRGGAGPRAVLRLLQAHVSTSTTTDLSNIPTAGCAFGTTGSLDAGFPRGSRAIAGWAPGQGRRNTAPPRSPRRSLAPGTSPQPRPVPGASCRGTPTLPLSGETWGEGESAIARQRVPDVPRRACKPPVD